MAPEQGGLLMVMPDYERMQFNRDDVVQDLRMWGYAELANRAARELPESLDGDELMAWCQRVGLSKDEVISRLGGSP